MPGVARVVHLIDSAQLHATAIADAHTFRCSVVNSPCTHATSHTCIHMHNHVHVHVHDDKQRQPFVPSLHNHHTSSRRCQYFSASHRDSAQ